MVNINEYIDHTLLKPFATQKDFDKLVEEAIKYQFASVCVSPYMAVPIRNVLNATGNTDLKVCTVVAFPHGNIPLENKVQEVDFFTERGVDEVDFVLNYGELKNGNINYVEREVNLLGAICARREVVSKCIVETCYLDEHEKSLVFSIVANSPVTFIKTSTGFGTGGATLEDVSLWNNLRGDSERPLIKAAGGIKTKEDALAMIAAGANRLGCSAGVSIMEG